MTKAEENENKLEHIGKELDKARAANAAAKVDLCGQYKVIKPILNTALPFIPFTRKFGKQVADAIELIMGIADNFCTT